MAAFDKCISLMKSEIGDFSEDDLKEIMKEVRAERQGRNADITSAQEEDAIKTAIEAGVKKVLILRRAMKRAQALNAVRRIEMFNYIKTNWPDNPAKGLEAFMVGVNQVSKASRRSVYANQRERAVSMMNLFNSHMMKGDGLPDIRAEFARGDYDDEFGEAIDLLVAHDGQPPAAVMKQAGVTEGGLRIARAFQEVNEAIVNAINKAGGFVALDPTYTIAHSHDANVMLHRAKKMLTGERGRPNTDDNYIAWRDFITDHLDMKKTLIEAEIVLDEGDLARLIDSKTKANSLAEIKEVDDFFRSAYEALVTGVHYAHSAWGDTPAHIKNAIMDKTGGEVFKGNRTKNIALKLSQSRLFIFTNEASSQKYMKVFGRGNPREQIIRGIEKNMFNVALMEAMGPNALSNYGTIKGSLRNIARGSAKGNTQLAVERVKDAESRFNLLDNEFRQLDGSAYIPAPNGSTLAKIGAAVRAFEATTRLGSAVISAISDLEFHAAALRHNGRTFLQSYDTVLSGLTEGRSSGEQKAILSRLAVTYEGRTGMFESRLMGTDDPFGHGLSSRIMSQYFKWNLLSPWTDFLREKAALTIAFDMAENANLRWSQLDDFQTRRFEQYGITGEEWDGVYSLLPKEMADGRGYLVPESIMDTRVVDDSLLTGFEDVEKRLANLEKRQARELKALDKRKVDAEAKADRKKIIGDRIQKIRQGILDAKRADLKQKLGVLIGDQVDQAILVPDARVRAVLQGSVERGTVTGEAWLSIMQFKSFPLSVLQTVVGRTVSGNGGDFFRRGGLGLGSPRAIAKSLASGNGSLPAMVQTMVMSTVFGYVAMQTKALLSGKTLRSPRTTEGPSEFLIDSAAIFQSAMMQGGSLGIYGDLLFGDLRTRYGGSAFDALMGPAFQTGSQAFSVAESFHPINMLFGDFSGFDSGITAGARFTKQHSPFINMFYTKGIIEMLYTRILMEGLNPGYTDRLNRLLRDENNQVLLGTGEGIVADT